MQQGVSLWIQATGHDHCGAIQHTVATVATTTESTASVTEPVATTAAIVLALSAAVATTNSTAAPSTSAAIALDIPGELHGSTCDPTDKRAADASAVLGAKSH